MRRLLLMVAMAAALLATGCSGAASEVKVTQADNGGEVTVGIGQVLVVDLEGNPSTGFTWSVADKPVFLTTIGEPEFKADSDLVGASGSLELRFSADEPGQGTLELWYARPWESVQPEQTFRIDVTCR